MALNLRVLALLSASLLVSACATTDDADDDDNSDVDLGGKGDGSFDVTPAELAVMLHEASFVRAADLRSKAGLAKRAAENIEKAQLGPDGERGTSDDVEFGTFAQLDAVPYVGKAALTKLRDFARESQDFPVGASERWHVRGGGAIEHTPDVATYRGAPTFAFDRQGHLLAFYMSAQHGATLAIDSKHVAVPVDADFLAYQDADLQLAVDASNAIHVFYGVGSDRFKHLTYKAGAWSELPYVPGAGLKISNGQGGEIYALVRSQRVVGINYTWFTDLFQFNADGTQTNQALDVPQNASTSLSVAADGTPIVAWTDAAAKVVKIRRVLAAGADIASAALPTNLLTNVDLSFTASETPTLVIGADSGWAVHVFRAAGDALTEVPVANVGNDVFGYMTPAALDAEGTITACAAHDGGDLLTEVVVARDGTAERHRIVNYAAGRYCFAKTDSAGKSHLVYGDSASYLHATLD